MGKRGLETWSRSRMGVACGSCVHRFYQLIFPRKRKKLRTDIYNFKLSEIN